MYSVEFKQSVSKDLKKIQRRIVESILVKIEKLKTDPYKSDIKKLFGTKSFFRLRVGDYRIIFQILSAEKKIIVFYIRHRKDVYKNVDA